MALVVPALKRREPPGSTPKNARAFDEKGETRKGLSRQNPSPTEESK
jgi:hypothetical protein